MYFRNRINMLLLLVAVVCLLLASIAGAAPSTDKLAKIDVGIIGSGASSFMIITGVVPQNTPLPTTVKIAVPTGAKIEWIGQVEGTDKEKDVEAQYTTETDGDWDTLTVTADKYRTVQAEVSTGKIYTSQGSDGTGSGQFVYVPATDADTVAVGIEIPQNAKFTAAVGYDSLGKGMAGEVFGTTVEGIKAGTPVTANVGYTLSTAQPNSAQTTGGTSGNTLMVVLIVLVIGAIAALLIILASQKSKKGPTGSTISSKRIPEKMPAAKKQKYAKAPPVKQQTTSAHNSTESGFKMNPVVIITLLIIIGGIALVLILAPKSQQIANVNGVYMKEFAQGDPCMNVTYELSETALADPAKAADDLVTKLEASDLELLKFSLDPEAKSLKIEFCESSEQGSDVDKVVKPTGYVGASNLKELNTVEKQADGTFSYLIAELAPCVTNTVSVKRIDGDDQDWVTKLGQAVATVPGITGVSFNPETNIATFGFCEESANDDTIMKALSTAGIKATLKSKAVGPDGAAPAQSGTTPAPTQTMPVPTSE